MKRTAVITGGTKGLGREISLALAQEGCFAMALYAHDESAACEWARLLADRQLAGQAFRQDVTNPDPAIWTRPELVEADQIVLVHNACATFSPTPFHQLSGDDFDHHYRVAVRGAWQCTQPLLRLMVKKRTGIVVTVLTSAIEGPAPKGFAAYLTAKYALQGFTLALAGEFAPRGLKVFSISPGFMDTPLTRQWDERLQQSIRSHSDRRTDPATAAAQLAKLILSPETRGTGENYPV
jgi:3-oxoacyl-[acyl-carrier protein] reductase